MAAVSRPAGRVGREPAGDHDGRAAGVEVVDLEARLQRRVLTPDRRDRDLADHLGRHRMEREHGLPGGVQVDQAGDRGRRGGQAERARIERGHAIGVGHEHEEVLERHGHAAA